jgi:NADH:ubiquinone oxidoreductase subunit K
MVAVLYFIQKGTFDAVLLAPATAALVGLALMTILHRFRGKLSVEQHRVLADLAMILPLPVVWM